MTTIFFRDPAVVLGDTGHDAVQRRENSRGIAIVIFQSLDKDKSGTVEQEEFINWVEKGSQMSEDQRKTFAASGKVQAAIILFLKAVEETIMQVADGTDARSNLNTSVIQSVHRRSN